MKYTKIEYHFDGYEHKFDVKKHGNSKINQPYIPTKASTKIAIKERLSNKAPRIVLNEVSESVGGLFGATSQAVLPCNIKKV